MVYQFPADLTTRIEALLAGGNYQSADEVLRDAITALEQQQQDLLSIQAGVADMEAGRFRPFAEIDRFKT